MFKYGKYYYLLIAFTGTLLAVFWQELNLFYFHTDFPGFHGLITSADEASYLRPPLNLLGTGEWKDSSTGIASHFMRPPGFGLYFLILKFFFGSKVWIAMKAAQILFFFFSILLFARVLDFLKINERARRVFTAIYAFAPCYSGFMYFIVTESITPFFGLLSTYYWLKSASEERDLPLGYILSSGFLLLIRPQLLMFILLFSGFYFLKKHYRAGLLSLLAFLPLLLWNVRSVSIAGKWMGMHPIYSETNNSLYRPGHEALTDLFRIWEYRGDVFHLTMKQLASDTSLQKRRAALQNIPVQYRSELETVFKDYQQLEHYRQTHYKPEEKIRSFLPGEQAFVKNVNALRRRLVAENKTDFHLETPLRSLKKLIVSSHLGLMIFQDQFRGAWWMEILRWGCFLLLFSAYLAAFSYPLKFFKDRQINELTVIAVGILISFVYLAYVQRMNEERYLTPLLPLCLAVLAGFFRRTANNIPG